MSLPSQPTRVEIYPTSTCASCMVSQRSLQEPLKLKRCSKCKFTLYCSRACLNSNRSSHQAVCDAICAGTRPVIVSRHAISARAVSDTESIPQASGTRALAPMAILLPDPRVQKADARAGPAARAGSSKPAAASPVYAVSPRLGSVSADSTPAAASDMVGTDPLGPPSPPTRPITPKGMSGEDDPQTNLSSSSQKSSFATTASGQKSSQGPTSLARSRPAGPRARIPAATPENSLTSLKLKPGISSSPTPLQTDGGAMGGALRTAGPADVAVSRATSLPDLSLPPHARKSGIPLFPMGKAQLSALSISEAIEQLIDAFKLRCDDKCLFDRRPPDLYSGAHRTPLFRAYLDLAEESGVLPDWWNREHREIAEGFVRAKGSAPHLWEAVSELDLKIKWRDWWIPEKLSALAEGIYGPAVRKVIGEDADRKVEPSTAAKGPTSAIASPARKAPPISAKPQTTTMPPSLTHKQPLTSAAGNKSTSAPTHTARTAGTRPAPAQAGSSKPAPAGPAYAISLRIGPAPARPPPAPAANAERTDASARALATDLLIRGSKSDPPPSAFTAALLRDIIDALGISDPSKIIAAHAASEAPIPSSSSTPSAPVLQSPTRNAYLSSLPIPAAMQHLIDAFRLRCDDDCTTPPHKLRGIYFGEEPLPLFRTFLDSAESKELLPVWWNKGVREKVEIQADKGEHDLSIHAYVTDEEIAARFGSSAVHLRELAAKVYEGITLSYGTPAMALAAAYGRGPPAESESDAPEDDWPEADGHARRLADTFATLGALGRESTVQYIMEQLRLESDYNYTVTPYIRHSITHPWSIPFFLLDPHGPPAAYLSSLSQGEAMRQLIDTFRLRMEDEYVFNLENLGIYGDEDPAPLFTVFLDKAEKSGVLPAWWSGKKRKEVKRMSQDREGGWCIHNSVVRESIIQAYDGDVVMPLKLRGLGEKIYGEAVYTN